MDERSFLNSGKSDARPFAGKSAKEIVMKVECRLSALVLFFVLVMAACGGGGDDSAPKGVATGAYPALITIDPSGKFAYVANWGSNDISVYRIDAATGALTAGTTVAAAVKPASIGVDRS